MYDSIGPANPTGSGGVNVNVMNPNMSSGINSLGGLANNPLFVRQSQVRQVASTNDIYNLPMGMNSSEFVLDANKQLVYYVETNNVGNKVKIIPFDIQQHIEEPEPTMEDVKAIESRFDEKLNNFKNEIGALISEKIEEALK